MTAVAGDPQVVIVGAGAAGIGAGLALLKAGVPFVILEAKDRVGGRAHSEATSLGHLWDHGCHWFHSADQNPLRAIADRLGHRYQPVQPGATAPMFVDGRWNMEAGERLKVWDYLDVVAASGKDVASSDFIAAGDPLAPLLRHWMKLMTSAEPEDVSSLDYGRFEDTHINLPVADGYGALMARLAGALPIVLNAPVSWIAEAGTRMRVETPTGIIATEQVIVTASINVLTSGTIRFSPGLPVDLREALTAVPCGTYEKMAVAVANGTFADFGPGYCDIVDPQGSEPVNMEISPFGRPIAIGHIAGNFAGDLVKAGDAGAHRLLHRKTRLRLRSGYSRQDNGHRHHRVDPRPLHPRRLCLGAAGQGRGAGGNDRGRSRGAALRRRGLPSHCERHRPRCLPVGAGSSAEGGKQSRTGGGRGRSDLAAGGNTRAVNDW